MEVSVSQIIFYGVDRAKQHNFSESCFVCLSFSMVLSHIFVQKKHMVKAQLTTYYVVLYYTLSYGVFNDVHHIRLYQTVIIET